MKKLLLAGSAILVSLTSFVNNDSSVHKHDHAIQLSGTQQALPDGVMMTDGTMKLIKGGQVTSMTAKITMSNGTIVLTDGTIIKKDNRRMLLKNGQHMNMAGFITEIKGTKK